MNKLMRSLRLYKHFQKATYKTFTLSDKDPKIQKPTVSSDAGKNSELANNQDKPDEEEDEDKGVFETSHLKYYLLAITGSLFLSGYLIKYVYSSRNDELDTLKSETAVSNKLNIGDDWKLVDQNGNSLSSEDLEGSYYIIYFGFCRCPDFCPQTLTKLSRALKLIQKTRESDYFDLKVVFVSVDPDRDTPDVIKRYVNNFGSEIIGISGVSNDDIRLKDIMKKFKIYAHKVKNQNDNDYLSATNYTLDHTVISYLMSDENKYITHIGPHYTAEETAERVIDNIMANENAKYQKTNIKNNRKRR